MKNDSIIKNKNVYFILGFIFLLLLAPSKVLAAEQLVSAGTSYSNATNLQYTTNGYFAQYGSGTAYFRFTTPSNSKGYTSIYYKNTSMNSYSTFELLSETESRIDYGSYISQNNTNTANVKLESGQTYYIRVGNGIQGGKFLLYLSYKEDKDENSKEKATALAINKEIVSSLDGYDDIDFFSFVAPTSGNYFFKYANNGINYYTDFAIYDWNTDEQLYNDGWVYKNYSTSKVLSLEKNHKYYIKIWGGGSSTGSYTLIVSNQSVSGIKLNQSEVVMNEDKSYKLTPTISPSGAYDKSVSWSSSDTSVAYINTEGEITAINAGSAIITCTSKEKLNMKATCLVIVIPSKMYEPYIYSENNTESKIVLQWSNYSKSSGFTIYSYDTKKKQWKIAKDNISKDVSKTSITSAVQGGKKKKLSAATTYKFKIASYTLVNGKKYYGAASEELITSTAPGKVKIKSVNANNGKVKVRWKKVTGATGYRIYAKSSGSNYYFYVGSIKGQKKESYTYNTYSRGKYTYKVVAYRNINNISYEGTGTKKTVKIR